MLTRHKHNNLVWIDLESPSNDEVRKLIEEFDLDPLVAEELLSPTLKPRAERYHNFLYLILHFPAFKHSHKRAKNQEVDFIVGENFIITARYDTIDPLHKFSKVFEVHSVLDHSKIGEHAGFVFFHMIRKLYRAVEHELEYINDELRRIEGDIFSGLERKMVRNISEVSREILSFKQALYAHRDVLVSFEEASNVFFEESFRRYPRALVGEYYRVYRAIEASLDIINELRETNNSLVSTKQNEIMKVLTIMAFVTFPLSLLASIFGMNTRNFPIIGHPYDFWIIIGIMVVATIFFFIFFKYKRWL